MSNRYDELVQKATIYVVKDVIKDIEQRGYFFSNEIYVTFTPQHPAVKISSKLKSMYPEKLSIQIQNNFQDLVVDDKGFKITTSLVTGSETLYIPFGSITQFMDQTEKFALKFNVFLSKENENDNNHFVLEKDPHVIDQTENVIKVDFSKD